MNVIFFPNLKNYSAEEIRKLGQRLENEKKVTHDYSILLYLERVYGGVKERKG